QWINYSISSSATGMPPLMHRDRASVTEEIFDCWKIGPCFSPFQTVTVLIFSQESHTLTVLRSQSNHILARFHSTIRRRERESIGCVSRQPRTLRQDVIHLRIFTTLLL